MVQLNLNLLHHISVLNSLSCLYVSAIFQGLLSVYMYSCLEAFSGRGSEVLGCRDLMIMFVTFGIFGCSAFHVFILFLDVRLL